MYLRIFGDELVYLDYTVPDVERDLREATDMDRMIDWFAKNKKVGVGSSSSRFAEGRSG